MTGSDPAILSGPGTGSPHASSAPPVEPIAIVGLACRLPGAPDPAAFWRLLADGDSAIGRPSAHRTGSGEIGELGKYRAGGWLDQVDRFDPRFFGIAPREAAAMDPQQRLVLELCWEALEDAGTAPGRLDGTSAGVFIGAIAADYATLLHRQDAHAISRHALTGLTRGIIANRVSYALRLRGPSLTVDSAQSSSLVAVHLACQSLRSGESTTALAGGVSLILAQESTTAVERFGALSPDDRCFTFDARANGYVRGEGGGVVVLKTLTQALADGDRIHCLILGGAMNNDGATDGLTVPGFEAQREVLRSALSAAGVESAAVQYVELHGTGTKVGDPIEAAALGAALGPDRTAGSPLLVGSAKTNVGHLEGASGIVGLLKTVLSVAHRRIPASLNFETPNPAIAFDELNLAVPRELGPWPDGARPLIAGVSSFGMGGTNCHLVLAEPPATAEPSASGAGPAAPEGAAVIPWPLSGRGLHALRAQAAQLRTLVEADPQLDPADLGYSLATTRTDFEHRALILGAGREDLLAGLRALERGEQSAAVVQGVARTVSQASAASHETGPVFVFPGQGSQWADMAVGLLDVSPVFAEHLDACAAALAPHIDWSLIDVLRGAAGAPSLDRVDVVQPALFAVMVSLAQLWRSYGVEPSAVIGQSQGEIAAAHIAGGLSLDTAAAIVALRSQVIASITGSGAGAMASIASGAAEVRARLAAHDQPDQLGVAAVNGPAATVVSGDPQALAELLAEYESEGVRVRTIPVDYASHSPQIEAIRERLLELLHGIEPRTSGLTFYSTVTGGSLDTAELTADYWYRNLRQTVEFDAAVRAAVADGHRSFIESSPHQALGGSIGEILETAGVHDRIVVGTLRRDHGDLTQFLSSLGQYHVQGGQVSWTAAFAPSARRVDLPTYAFQRQRYWFDTADEDVTREQPAAVSGQTLLDLVRASAAVVLGHQDADSVEIDLTFKDLGLDSSGAVELRDRLAAASGLRLPATLTYDHPTPAAVANFLVTQQPELPGSIAPTQKLPVTLPASDEDPIALVSMSGRWPGGANTPEELWELLRSGTDAIGPFPDNRGWDLARLYDADPDRPGTSYAREGGFLHDADRFDAAFFGVSPREAAAMDPQQRLLLESAWELCERAGLAPAGLRGSRTGVFVGVIPQDYGPPLHRTPLGYDGYALTGSLASVASGRLAYVLGLEGPAITVDTACSSSLVAIHLAAQALRQGECDLALAGGVTVMSSPGMFTEFSRQRGLAPDGRCKPFASAADGTAWSEGVGLVLLERLSDARRRGHQVLALVRGSAVNQDGASNGLTAPNGPSQERVIRQALAAARLSPSDVDAVEAHGTGTTLGDPIEAQALLATYGRERAGRPPLLLGSLKSNIGHAQAAAGVTGVIAMVQAIRHGVLPRTLHVDEPSTHVDWAAGEVSLLTEEATWPSPDTDDGRARPRRAAVSSFGISGTNAHLILEQAPTTDGDTAQDGPAPTTDRAPLAPWILSAKSDVALRAQASRLREQFTSQPDADPAEIGFSLATTRNDFEHRALILGAGREDLLAGLHALERGEQSAALVQGTAQITSRTGGASSGSGPVFVFPGQGSQWAQMAVGLLDASPVFARYLDDCEAALAPHVDWSLVDVLRGAAGAPSLDRVDVVQPALFAVMVSLAQLWRSYGVEPSAVIGQSQGEIAAAHIAGGLSLDAAAAIVALRSQVIATIPGSGAMASIALSAAEVRARLAARDQPDRLGVAAVNGPAATVVSGDPQALAELLAEYEAEGVRVRTIPVDYASHSPQIEAIRERLLDLLRGIEPRPSTIAFYSTVTGGRLDTAELTTDYWYRNLRQTVELDAAVRATLADGHRTFIESSPHQLLGGTISEILESADIHKSVVVGTLRRDQGDLAQFLSSLGQYHVQGGQVSWPTAFPPNTRRVDLPTYPFQRTRFWLDQPAEVEGIPASTGLVSTDHPLLGAVVDLADGAGLVLTGHLSLHTHSWLADHAIHGSVLLPGAALTELALHAAERVGSDQVEELTLETPLVLTEAEGVQLQVLVGGPDESGRQSIAIHSRSDQAQAGTEWTRHATGFIAPAGDLVPAAEDVHGVWPPKGAVLVDVSGLYQSLAEKGYEYGPAFQGLRAAWRLGDEVFAEVQLDDGRQPDAQQNGFGIHPALLDAALHAVVGISFDSDEPGRGTRLPFSWTGVRLHATGATALRVRVAPADHGSVRIFATDPVGGLVFSVDLLAFRSRATDRNSLLRLDWIPAPTTTERSDVEYEYFYANDGSATGTAVPATHAEAERLLHHLKDRLDAADATSAQLVVITHDAVSTRPGEGIHDLPAAALWGLIRSAQSEYPNRIIAVDLDRHPDSSLALASALATGEPQLAIRRGDVLVPRLARLADDTQVLAPPAGTSAWRLDVSTPGSLDDLALLPSPEAEAPLTAGQVRIAVRAAGLNFRDVIISLGMYPGGARIGAEGAGVVVEVAPDVTDLAPGDRVMGLIQGTIGPLAVADRRLLARFPECWSFAQAAATPVAFLTAYHGLADLAGLRGGERVLIHAATGGVGLAAVALARHWGAEVFATASPTKWATLTALGLDEHHIASSRTLDFEDAFRTTAGTGGGINNGGLDVVLNALAHEFTDASLRLLGRTERPGGRFIELGKTDKRDPAEVAAHYPGVEYQAFDLFDVDRDRIAQMLDALSGLFDSGALSPLPVSAWDIQQAPRALRYLSQARHTGKLALTFPPSLDPDGTVLITGGTGALGALAARRLVTRHGVRRLLLVSRSGPDAPGAAELSRDLAELGAAVTISSCDLADQEQLAALLATVPAAHPLTAIVHTAGILDDALISSLTTEQLHAVLRPKVDAAWNLHQLTRHLDLAAVLLYSSAVGVLGNAGQANYAAANTFLDALAHHRAAQGLPATSLDWGHWAQAGGMTGQLTRTDTQRLARSGLAPMTDDHALTLFDAAFSLPYPVVVAARIDSAALTGPDPAHVLRGLVRPGPKGPSARRVAAGTVPGAGVPAANSALEGLAEQPPAERRRRLLTLVRTTAALVLGHPTIEAIKPDRGFLDGEFDSLSAVELRNKLSAATGLRLPTTTVFDYPTPVDLADYLGSRLVPDEAPTPVTEPIPSTTADSNSADLDITAVSDEELFDFLDNELGIS